MTLVGKIFTVLVLIMSISFMMLAVTVFATHRNWQAMVTDPGGLKSQIEALSKTNGELRDEIVRAKDQIALEQAARRFALAAGQARLEQLDEALELRTQEYTDLLAAHGTIVETLDRNQNILESLTKENEGLRTEIRTAQQARDDYFNQVVMLTDSVNRMEGNSRTLQEQHDMLLVQNGKMAKVMRKFEISVDTPVDGITPRVDGYVIAVNDTNLIEISIGSDDGLRKNHFMEVYRKNNYVGRVEIVMVKPDRAVAKIIPEFRRGIIRKGDRVAAKLS
ncbi:MAG TPA: hypothetical protein QF564_03950 [Pirellulaceae bacterium]|jgi:chromosome condensin MukBEF ATPase and DNA-binding subunit MukB|nr:hypothetical protein [Pirellulaceae bacterium]